MESFTVESSDIGKDEENEENLDNLVHELIESYKESYPAECYEFLKHCLRVKDYNVQKARKLLRGTESAIKGFSYLFSKHDIEKSASLHSDGITTVLKTPDEFGHKVFLFRLGQWNPTKVDCDQICTTIILIFLWLLGQSKHFQRKGVVGILDMSSFGLQQVRNASIRTISGVVHALNDSSPGKIKAIHLIYHPRIFGPLFKLLKPFIKEKLSGRIHFHGDSTASLQKYFQPEILPESLGGKLGEVEAVDKELVERFVADESYASEINRLGFPKN